MYAYTFHGDKIEEIFQLFRGQEVTCRNLHTIGEREQNVNGNK
jgi:hypothetical protein